MSKSQDQQVDPFKELTLKHRYVSIDARTQNVIYAGQSKLMAFQLTGAYVQLNFPDTSDLRLYSGKAVEEAYGPNVQVATATGVAVLLVGMNLDEWMAMVEPAPHRETVH